MESLKDEINKKVVSVKMTKDREEWKRKIYYVDHKENYEQGRKKKDRAPFFLKG